MSTISAGVSSGITDITRQAQAVTTAAQTQVASTQPAQSAQSGAKPPAAPPPSTDAHALNFVT